MKEFKEMLDHLRTLSYKEQARMKLIEDKFDEYSDAYIIENGWTVEDFRTQLNIFDGDDSHIEQKQ